MKSYYPLNVFLCDHDEEETVVTQRKAAKAFLPDVTQQKLRVTTCNLTRSDPTLTAVLLDRMAPQTPSRKNALMPKSKSYCT